MFRRIFKNERCRTNPEFERVMASIPNLSCSELNEMHDILLTYSIKYPVPIPGISPEAYKQKISAYRQTPIVCGGIFGCKTYGEAEQLNIAIVKRLDELEE